MKTEKEILLSLLVKYQGASSLVDQLILAQVVNAIQAILDDECVIVTRPQVKF